MRLRNYRIVHLPLSLVLGAMGSMEIKYFVVIILGMSILGMWLTTNKASKNTVDDFQQLLASMPVWKKIIYGICDVYPFDLLNETGKKWQVATYILLALALVSGMYIGQLART